MENPIKIGVSSCLLGNHVRYDGGHALDPFITATLGKYVEFEPICPESECGLGIPRPAMHLKGTLKNPRLVVIKTGQDHTDRMVLWAKKRLEQLSNEDLSGFIFKKKSPSCGMTRVKVFGLKGRPIKKGRGIFADMFIKRYPLLPVEEEGGLSDPLLRKNFIERIFVMQDRRSNRKK